MQNVEGNYDEIVEWLDNQNYWGVGYTELRGMTEDGFLNVGLFSVCETHDDKSCTVCQGFNGRGMTTNFKLLEVSLDTDDIEVVIEIEEPDKTHLITF